MRIILESAWIFPVRVGDLFPRHSLSQLQCVTFCSIDRQWVWGRYVWRKSEEKDSHIRRRYKKHLTAAYARVCLHHGWQKLTSARSPLFRLSREEEFDEYFEDMFLWLPPPSAACHPAVTTLASPLTLSAFPSQCACEMFPPPFSFFPQLYLVLSSAVFKCRSRNKPNVYPVTSLL